MLDFLTGATPAVHDDPYRWAYFAPLFSAARAAALARTFPGERFGRSVGRDGHYDLWDRTVVDGGVRSAAADDLSPEWSSLLEQLCDDEYRQAVARLMEVPLDGTALKVRLCIYGPGCWMLPHTDRPDRVATQIIYLTEAWQPEWGGTLRVLRSESEDDVAQEIVPSFNTSVMFRRCDRSYHAVTPVREAQAKPRRSILAQFIRQEGAL